MALPICVKEQISLLRILPSTAQTLRLLYWTRVRTPLGHGCFSVLFLGFYVDLCALDRSTSRRVPCQVFFLSLNGHYLRPNNDRHVRRFDKPFVRITAVFLNWYLSGRILLEVTLPQALSVDASSERHLQFNIDRLPHNLRDSFVKLKGFQTQHLINIEEKV